MKTTDENRDLLRALECARLHDVAPSVALEIIATYDGRVAAIPLDDLNAAQERPAEIDRLYREIRELNERASEEPALAETAAAKLDRLRKLQAEEAAEMQERFKAQLPFQPGEGRALLEHARRSLADDRSAA